MFNKTVLMEDGYNGHTCRFNAVPVERDGDLVKLVCAEPGKEYLTAWKRESEVHAALNKIPAYLIGPDSMRIEEHQLMMPSAARQHGDFELAKTFLERRAKLLGFPLANRWTVENGEVRVWVKSGQTVGLTES